MTKAGAVLLACFLPARFSCCKLNRQVGRKPFGFGLLVINNSNLHLCRSQIERAQPIEAMLSGSNTIRSIVNWRWSMKPKEANKALAPSRPVFPLGGSREFQYRVCAPPVSPAAVGEAWRWDDADRVESLDSTFLKIRHWGRPERAGRAFQ